MVTAVSAIVLGVWDSAQTRKHNRLSVSPYLVCDYAIGKTTSNASFVIRVSNEGVGPAIIEGVTIELPESLGGGTFTDWNPIVDIVRARGASVPSYWNFRGGEALGVQRGQELFKATIPDGPNAEPLLRELSLIKVAVRYSSIYGDSRIAKLN